MGRLATLAVLLGLAAAVARGEEPAPPLPRALAALRDATPAGRAKALEEALALEPTVDQVRKAFDAGLPAPAAVAGWSVLRAADESGVERPYHLYVPQGVIEDGRPVPLLLDLHGGVNRPEFISDEDFARFRDVWTALAEELDFVVAMPLARTDCMWWSPAGVAHVRATIRDVRRHAPVDDDRIVATGFSDGGSGCWFLAMAAPDPFAALMPMNGHPAVAVGASGRQLYLENARLTPLFVAMTQDDPLYPAASVLPHVLRLFEIGAKAHLVSYPDGGHRPVYFQDLGRTFANFVVAARRDALPRHLAWSTAEPETGRVRWIEILEVGPAVGDAVEPPDVNVMSRPLRVVLGIVVNRDHPGPGAAVQSVTPDTPAAAMGIREGDVVVGLDDQEIGSLADLREALSGKSFGDTVKVIVRRGEETVALEGRFPPFHPEPVYPRDRPTAGLAADVRGNAIDIESRNVRRVRLLLSPAMFDLGKEIVVRVNGIERARKKPDVSPKRMLERFAVEADGRRLFPAEMEVVLPAKD